MIKLHEAVNCVFCFIKNINDLLTIAKLRLRLSYIWRSNCKLVLSMSMSCSTNHVPSDVCGGSLRASAKPGTIYSHHNFNNTDLPSYQSCRWTITAKPKHRIVLTFLEFDINGGKRGRKCRRNYLDIKDSNRRLGRYCNGRNVPNTIVSRTNVLDIRLNTKKLPGKGFIIKFSKL